MLIESQRKFTYTFRAYPGGTHFYHSHSGFQSVTAFGPLIFSDLRFEPDRLTQEHNLLASPFIWQGEPNYLLINDQRNFVLTVDPNKRYLLRLICATTLSTIVFGIDDHIMTVVEVDGTLIIPKNVSSIELSSGQRYSVIIHTKLKVNRIYLMQLSIRWKTLINGSNCTGLLRYSTITQIQTNLTSLPYPLLSSEQDLLLFSMNNSFETLLDVEQMPRRSADKEIYLYGHQARTSDGLGMRWLMNNALLDKLRLSNLTNYLLIDVYNRNENTLPYDATYSVQKNQLIDIVLQNTVAKGGACESHPFHLHGHQFWIHSQGEGLYNSSTKLTYVSKRTILRDTLTLYPTSYSDLTPNRPTANYLKPCGWIKLRFIANNPGLWLLHCHIGSHIYIWG